ncbi:MAG: UDP-N-acetylmuramoyl-tripeptide--D-alanyl-D-alanine ligase [Patescibacteria group bacterium]
MRKILQKILKILAILVLKIYKPVIIAITGNVGKTSTKEAIYCVLKSHFGENRVRRNLRNYNNEIGVPLTIFGLETAGRSIFRWLIRFIKIFWMIIFKVKYPDFLVIEMGADRPGDIKYLTRFVHPEVGIITAFGEIPVHIEFFESPEQVAREKRILVDCLKEDEVAILNYDDEIVRQMAKELKAKVLTYGLKEKADIRATNYDLKVTPSTILGASELNFKLEFEGSSVPAKLINVLGVQHLYSALGAAAVGIVFNMNLVEIVEALKQFQPLPGRMRVIKGIKNTLIVDDSYNAALLSMEAALDSLKVFEDRRKIVVLGDMLEIGEYAPEAHRRIGKKASEIADLIFTVGSRAKFIAESAIKNGFDEKKIFQFDVSDDAGKIVQEQMKEGDVILVKGSRAMKMEKIIKEIMAEPEKAEELLVRG